MFLKNNIFVFDIGKDVDKTGELYDLMSLNIAYYVVLSLFLFLVMVDV